MNTRDTQMVKALKRQIEKALACDDMVAVVQLQSKMQVAIKNRKLAGKLT